MQKLHKGDKVAILSPSFAAPGLFPKVFELGLQRIRDVFGLEPVEYPTTRKVGASTDERAQDLIAAFENPEIKAVISSIGGDDQVTYIYKLPKDSFANNPKPFLGFSDNTHFCNFLFQQGIPSFYGASVMTQFAMQKEMDEYTIEYIRHALFDEGEFELFPAKEFNEIGLDWSDDSLLNTKRTYEENSGLAWDGTQNAQGVLWGGCLESLDGILRNDAPMPSLEQFSDIVLMLETSEEIPSADYVAGVIRALGERDVLNRIQGVLVGRPKAWEFDKPLVKEERQKYVADQQDAILKTIRTYNQQIPIIQNLNFGHTDPQIPMPYGGRVRINSDEMRVFASF